MSSLIRCRPFAICWMNSEPWVEVWLQQRANCKFILKTTPEYAAISTSVRYLQYWSFWGMRINWDDSWFGENRFLSTVESLIPGRSRDSISSVATRIPRTFESYIMTQHSRNRVTWPSRYAGLYCTLCNNTHYHLRMQLRQRLLTCFRLKRTLSIWLMGNLYTFVMSRMSNRDCSEIWRGKVQKTMEIRYLHGFPRYCSKFTIYPAVSGQDPCRVHRLYVYSVRTHQYSHLSHFSPATWLLLDPSGMTSRDTWFG